MENLVSSENKSKDEQEKVSTPSIKPPLTYDEYIKMEGMSEWPQRITSEQLLSLGEDVAEWTLENIGDWLLEAALVWRPFFPAVDMALFDKVEGELAQFENDLMIYATKFLNVGKDAVPRPVVNKTEEKVAQLSARVSARSDLMKTKAMQKKKQRRNMGALMDGLGSKSVDFCHFPGFYEGELNELPSSVEASVVLYKVTKALKLTRGFRSFWKKIYTSEASVAMLQDTFWWMFIEFFETNDCSEARRNLFNRICDTFAALIFSVNPEVKDEFFKYYPEALAMSIYSSFYEAFPESHKLFGSDFKQRIVNIVYEWIIGGHPLPGSYNNWNLSIIEAGNIQIASTDPFGLPAVSVAQTVMQAMRTLNDPRDVKMDIEGFEKSVRQLSAGVSKRGKRNNVMFAIKESGGDSNGVTRHGTTTGTLRSVTRSAEKKRDKVEETKRPEDVRSRLRRTELGRVPSGKQTYKELIEDQEKRHSLLRKGYDHISQEADVEIKAIQKRRKDINRQIQRLQKELDATWSSPLELKVVTNSILSQIDAPVNAGNCNSAQEKRLANDKTSGKLSGIRELSLR